MQAKVRKCNLKQKQAIAKQWQQMQANPIQSISKVIRKNPSNDLASPPFACTPTSQDLGAELLPQATDIGAKSILEKVMQKT